MIKTPKSKFFFKTFKINFILIVYLHYPSLNISKIWIIFELNLKLS